MRSKLTLAGVALLAATAIACGAGSDDTAGPGAQDGAATPVEPAAEHTVVLEVTGVKSADITYGLGTDQSQDNGAKVPWKKTLKTSDDAILATVVAQNKGGGTITCKITIDGKLAKENKSKGQYAVVTCANDPF